MRTRSLHLVPTLALVHALAAGAASAQSPHTAGYVDGSAFAALATEDGDLVEIQLGPSLMNALAGKRTGKDVENSVFRQLRSIEAYIVGLENDPARLGR